MSANTSTPTQEYAAPVDAAPVEETEALAVATDAGMDALAVAKDALAVAKDALAVANDAPGTPGTPPAAEMTTPTQASMADAPPALKRATRADFFGDEDEDEGAPLPQPFKRPKTVAFAARELGSAFEEEGAPGPKRPSAEEWLADESQHAKDDEYSTPERIVYETTYKCDSVGTHFLKEV